MDVTLTVWAVTVAAVLGLIALDFFTVSKNPHEVSMKEAAAWSVFYIGIAIAWGGLIWWYAGSQYGVEYYAGWLVEKSLSVDNLFVFVIILSRFAVPTIYYQKVLLFGILFALVLRSIFIALGAAMLTYFSWTFLLFGAVLIWTAVQLARHRNEDPDVEDNRLVAFARRRLPMAEDWHGGRLTLRLDGRRLVTPLFLVMIAIASTDVLFALDSIPAVYGITSEPYIVFAANAFALLGLRALFFLLRGLLDKIVYLSIGLAVILGFIGVKLILTYLHEQWPDTFPKIPTAASLGFIVLVLVVASVASWLKVRRDPAATAHAGSVRASRHKGEPMPETEPGDGPARPRPGPGAEAPPAAG